MSTPAKEQRQQLTGQEALERVRAILGYFRSGMLTTVTESHVHARPMALQGKTQEFDGTLWFFTDDRGDAVTEIAGGARAAVIFQSDDKDAYLQLDGTAAESRDREKMKELYTPFIRTWFPDGLDDPHLTMIRFDATQGHFWDSKAGMLQLVGAFAKAMITGKPGFGGDTGDAKL